MAVAARRPSGPHFLPTTTGGAVACWMFAFSVMLLAARVLLTPAIGLPLNFLTVFVTMAAAGVLALLAIVLGREHSVASFVTLVAGLLAATLLVGEAFGPGQPVGASLTEHDSGATVTVDKGGQIFVELKGNPTTGYSWEATISNPDVLRTAAAPTFKPIGDALGAGGTFYFWFEATAPGRTELTLNYRRSWETGVAPLKSFQVRIVVR